MITPRHTNTTSLQVVPGSIQAAANAQNITLAEALLDAEYLVLLDASGSMSANDAPGGKERFQAACDELKLLQARLNGKVAVFSFADKCEFAPGGVPRFLHGGTDLARALRETRKFDGLVKQLYVLCDGWVDSESEALAQAARFKTTTINTIFIGPESDTRGRDFLGRLAAACKGTTVLAEKVKELGAHIERLMLTDGKGGAR
jgi:Mg-chelatase subunit ChlD